LEFDLGKVVETLRLTNVFNPKKWVSLEAVVDTGATMIVLPMGIVRKLGLRRRAEVTVRYANGTTALKTVFDIAKAEVAGRSGDFDVIAEDNGAQPLIGQILLEQLDLIVDPKKRCVRPNPLSPDLPMIEVF
jgi:predicted aspartyl protease